MSNCVLNKIILASIFIIILGFVISPFLLDNAFAVEGEHIFSNVKLSSKNLYTDSDYQFAINYPNNWEVIPNAATFGGGASSSLVQFSEKSSSTYPSNFIVGIIPLQKTDYDSYRNDYDEQGLLDTVILGASASSENFKLIDSKIKTYDDGIKLEYTFLSSVKLSDLTDLDSDAKTFLPFKTKNVLFYTENSLYYINFNSIKDAYSSGISSFDISVNSFVSGNYKQILDNTKKADEKILADKKALDAKKIADAKKANDAKKIADAKKVADAKALADKKAADAKKAEKIKLAKERVAAKKAAEAKK